MPPARPQQAAASAGVEPMLLRTSDLQMLDVVNVADGRRLGTVRDLDIDVASGTIRALLVPLPGSGFLSLGRRNEIAVPWDKVVKIGIDCILVDLPEAAHVDVAAGR